MLIHEAAGIVHLIVYHNIEILLRRMRRDVRVGEFLRFRHLLDRLVLIPNAFSMLLTNEMSAFGVVGVVIQRLGFDNDGKAE